MNAKDLKHFEGRLLQEREKLVREISHLQESIKNSQRDSAGDLSAYSFHMADLGTDAMEREKQFLFASTEGRLLMSIDDALRRLYRREYGTCQSCSTPIARPRLDVVPHATLCLACKEQEEKSSRTRAD